jgi:hypothetical protein
MSPFAVGRFFHFVSGWRRAGFSAMTPKTTTVTDSDIRAAVLAQGFADCAVVRQFVKDRFENHGTDGTWYALFVTFKDGMTPQCWGRRRTMAELLDMAQRGPLC